MQTRRYAKKSTDKKLPVRAIRRVGISLVLVLTLAFTSFSSVIANTVSASVIDGDKTYSFAMDSAETDDIMAKALELGMEPINPEMDVYEKVGNTTTVNVRRGVSMQVSEAGNSTLYKAYKGDTVEMALAASNIILKEKDEVSPAKDVIIDSDFAVDIKRFCTVTVSADGQKKEVSLTGARVRDAILAAGFKMGADDEANYAVDKTLFDQMNIRISRVVNVTITADKQTKAYKVAADTVEEAVQKAGIELSKDDRVTPKLTEKVSEGMVIDVKRVEIKEETVKEEVDFETKTEESADLYKGDSKVKVEGAKGEKDVTYKVTYVEGVEEGKEKLSENVTKEPVARVLIEGTKARPASSGSSGGSGSASTGNGSLVDHNGNAISYRSVLNGTASAYCDGGLTAMGDPCGYGYVAVNPNVIPYGSRLYICSPDGSYVYGYAIASDTGGALQSGRVLVDLWMESEDMCYSFGLRNMNVYILS